MTAGAGRRYADDGVYRTAIDQELDRSRVAGGGGGGGGKEMDVYKPPVPSTRHRIREIAARQTGLRLPNINTYDLP